MRETVIESTLGDAQTLLRYPAGATIFREGEQPRGVYILHSGEADLLFSARDGHTKPLRLALPGQILGLSSIVTQRPHDNSAIARTGCETGFIDREEFLAILDEAPAVWFNVLRILSTEVNAAYDDIRSLVAR